MLILFLNTAYAICEGKSCNEAICCPQGGDCCWTNDPVLFHSIWIVPIIVLLLFLFPISQRMVHNAVLNKTPTKIAQSKAQIYGTILSILSLVGIHLGVHKCLWPKGSYNPIPPEIVITYKEQVVSPPFETAELTVKDAAVSEFPITCYDWKLTEKPIGSAIPLNTSQESTFSIKPDLFGAYRGTVTIKNAYGIEGTKEFTVEAVPKQKLWIEMFWQHPNDDIDLHLIRDPEKTLKKIEKAKTKEELASLLINNDCFFSNCTPSTPDSNPQWGSAGSADDPKLDIDDKPNTGPENINILEPENIDYLIRIHDYPVLVYEDSNEVTIRVYFNKEKVWEGVRTVVGEDTLTDVLIINGASGKITEK